MRSRILITFLDEFCHIDIVALIAVDAGGPKRRETYESYNPDDHSSDPQLYSTQEGAYKPNESEKAEADYRALRAQGASAYLFHSIPKSGEYKGQKIIRLRVLHSSEEAQKAWLKNHPKSKIPYKTD